MADAQDLHQIEYRHHPTKDLSPMASSMISRESLSGWDARIRAWVRHPDADLLPESVCYQLFPNGQAAVAWRYWDERAAVRADGSRGRPLVSRVLLGPASTLTFEVALACGWMGPAEQWLGTLPGQVPDGDVLPTVSGAKLTSWTIDRSPEFDQAAGAQDGLQAVVAAALAEQSAPLAINIPADLVRLPLRVGVQCPLLWGLRRITGQMLGPTGRPWSFSTFERPLGDIDPVVLPAIVFREAVVKGGPPARWRREANVRPFETGALEADKPYAALAELAGLLVASYRAWGGDDLARFIAEHADGESFQARVDQVAQALRRTSQPARRRFLPSSPVTPAPVEQRSEVRQRAHAGRDANVAGRDLNVIYQYPDPSSEAAALGVLSARDGATLLATLAGADETLNRARNVLTGVSPSVAAPALKVLLRRDEDLVIALLATTNEAKVQNLVSAMGPDGAGLEKLLEATEAITQCESAMHKTLGERAGRFMRATSARGTQGFMQNYANGSIHWSPRHGAQATTGMIWQCHTEADGSQGPLGFPVAAAVKGKHPGTGTECTWQLFEGPSDYSGEVCAYLDVQCGGTVVSSRRHGTHAAWGSIGELSELGWRDRSSLGLPVGDAVPVGPSRRVGEAGTSGRRQRFEDGTIYHSDKTGPVRVPSEWDRYLEDKGGVAGWTGFPVSPALDAAASPYGTTGRFQRFEGAWDYPEDIVSCWSGQDRPGGAIIYHSQQHGNYAVREQNGVLYERLNGTASWLGFPTSDETDASMPADGQGRTIQRFEGGAIFCTRKHGSVPVQLEILNYLAEQPYSSERLGFPIRESEPLASGNDDYIQFFEHAVVTVQGSVIQVWIDPAIQT